MDMSAYCPLCGKKRNEDSVFCDDCKKKIEREYEVDVPERKQESSDPQTEMSIEKKTVSTGTEEHLSEKDSSKIEKETSAEPEAKPHVADDSEVLPGKPAKKRLVKSIWFISAILLFVLGFLYYGNNVRKSNLEKLQWDAALKENSIGGYIAYMVQFPKGKHYDIAEESIRILKDNEAASWEELQQTENSAKLRDFLNSHLESSLAPLIKKRLDSIEWISALNDNSAESYLKYKEMVQRNDFEGDYLLDAESRFRLLSQTYPVQQSELDSLKGLADGFFAALSSLDADRLERYLAPRVFRFFGPGGGTREKIIGDLLISGSKSQSPTISFVPDLNGLTYEKTQIEHYLVNLPVQKMFVNADEKQVVSTGFIIQMEVDRDFQVITVIEDEPRRK